MILTEEQRAIIDEGQRGTVDIEINALAGCAKTTTLIELLKWIPQRSILFAAFNRGIADEAERRRKLIALPKTKAVVVQTLHALGREIVLKHFPRLRIDKTATEGLVAERGLSYEVRRSAVQLVRRAKEVLPPSITPPSMHLMGLGFDQQLFHPKLTTIQIERAVEIAGDAIRRSADMRTREAIDFCDMTWLPAVLNLEPGSRYQAILVDEAQDVSMPQVLLLRRVSLPTTRVVATGDVWQQIYAWRGSLGAQAFKALAPRAVKAFPLTITWRCSRAVVRAANELVPELRAHPNAEEGVEEHCTLGELPLRIAQAPQDGIGTFILSRRNAELLDCALFLWRNHVKFQLNAGRELLAPVFQLLDELDLRDDAKFRASLTKWYEREAAKADESGSTSYREMVDDLKHMFTLALRHAEPRQLRRLFNGILAENDSGVLLSTVHKVKGLEAEWVFLLKRTFARHQQHFIEVDGDRYEAPEAPIEQEELNIEYVGITRAKYGLVWVDLERKVRPVLLEIPVAQIPAADLDAAYALADRAFGLAATAKAPEADQLAARCDALLRRIRGA